MKVITYISDHFVLLTILLVVSVFAALLFVLYTKEKRKVKKLQLRTAGERRLYRAFEGNKNDFYLLVRRKDLRVLYVSPNFEQITGIDTEVIDTDIEALREIVDHRTARRIVKELSQWDKKSVLITEAGYTVCGQEEQQYCKIRLSLDEKTDSYLCVFYNITQEYQDRQRLYEKLEQAHQESQAKTDFLSKMSHEIRTPMNGILGMLNLAKGHLENPQATGEYLKKAESLSQFLLTLINDILDMSRIESGKMELEAVPFDLFGVADKLNSMFKNTVEAKGIQWKIEMQDCDVRYVIGDELRLTQVIINFISNAHKFTPAGGTVSVTFRQMSKIEGKVHLMIRVKDTGKGIKEDFLKNIFRPFEQEDASTAHHYGGSGLGMAIADNIIRLMDGQIIVESELGKGSEFIVYITLPIAEGNQDLPDDAGAGYLQMDAKEEDYRKAVEEFTLEGLKILLAEDNDINAEIAIEILQMEGAHADRARDGAEALHMFAESEVGAYDVILMDIQMPNMDGYQATKEIRKLDRLDVNIPIFAMSANAFVEDKRKSIKVGMNGHVSKPVDFDELRRVIAEHIYSR